MDVYLWQIQQYCGRSLFILASLRFIVLCFLLICFIPIKSSEAYSPGHNHYLLTHAIYVWLTFMWRWGDSNTQLRTYPFALLLRLITPYISRTVLSTMCTSRKSKALHCAPPFSPATSSQTEQACKQMPDYINQSTQI